LQTNKVKQIAGLVHLIHGVDSWRLLAEINKQGQKLNRAIGCLLQVHIAQEETKFGLDETELKKVFQQLPSLPFVQVRGLMGMASNTSDTARVRKEFAHLKKLADDLSFTDSPIISMGMSNDYALAVEEGSTLVRIGSLLFGARN
jgi:pyridoxal phosphate enzyme (YggS family)